MVLSRKGRERLSLFAKARERTSTGRFLPLGTKYVYDMSYIKSNASRDTLVNQKWLHGRITIYSLKDLVISRFRMRADLAKPFGYGIPKGDRKNFEAFQDLKISKKQAKREGIDDQDYHDEEYSGRGGGLRDT